MTHKYKVIHGPRVNAGFLFIGSPLLMSYMMGVQQQLALQLQSKFRQVVMPGLCFTNLKCGEIFQYYYSYRAEGESGR